MNNIYDYVRDEVMAKMKYDALERSDALKPISVRIQEHFIKLSDIVSTDMGSSRQTLIQIIITNGLLEAARASASTCDDESAAYVQLLKDAGFPAEWHEFEADKE